MAKSAALQFKVSKMVSTSRMSAPPSSKPRTCSEYEVASSSNAAHTRVSTVLWIKRATWLGTY